MSDALRRHGVWIGFALLLAVLPRVFTSGTSLTMMSLMGIMMVFALSYNMLLGQTGMLSFGHAVYYGLAGFIAIHAMRTFVADKLPIPLPLVPIVGGLAGLAFGVVFGSVSTRRAGTAFAMISLGLAELVAASSLVLRSFFGGEEGITADRSKLFRVFDLSFGPQVQVYYLIAVWTFVCVLAMYAITRTPFGRMCNAVRENPERAEFVGYSTQTVRWISFSLAGLFAGVAGALAAISFEIMNALSVSAGQSGVVLLMTYIGGVGHFMGPIIGAVLITALQISLSDITGAWMLYFGLMFILVVMFVPGGIAGWIMLHEPVVKAGLTGLLAVPYLTVAVPMAASALGLVGLVELSHHMLVKAATEGGKFRLFGVAVDGSSLVPWLVMVAIAAAGFLVARALWPRVTHAWGQVHDELKRRGLR